MGNNIKFGTENLCKVQEMFESNSDHFTYRQRKFKNLGHADRIVFERESNEFDLEEERIKNIEEYNQLELYDERTSYTEDIYNCDVTRLEYKDDKLYLFN